MVEGEFPSDLWKDCTDQVVQVWQSNFVVGFSAPEVSYRDWKCASEAVNDPRRHCTARMIDKGAVDSGVLQQLMIYVPEDNEKNPIVFWAGVVRERPGPMEFVFSIYCGKPAKPVLSEHAKIEYERIR